MTGASEAVLDELRSAGVHVWVKDGRLRYRGPAGALDDRLRAAVATHRAELVATLDRDARPAGQAPPVVRGMAPANAQHPLSAAQRRFWFLDQATPGNPAFNLPYAFRLTGDLDVAALRDALAAVVDRHDALRTTFTDRGGEPLQEVRAPGGSRPPLPVLDLSAHPDPAAASREEVDREFRIGFDLARGPLLRGRLLRLAEREHTFLVTFHHIVFDGWSCTLLLEELAEVYRAALQHRTPELTELPFSYADYAVWQNTWLTDRALADGLAYWRTNLAGAPPGLDLPTDRPRPVRQTYEGAVVPVALPSDVVAGLGRLGREEGATQFMVLLAAFAVALSRTSGQPDLVVGTPVAGRSTAELDRVIGFFVNMLPLRVDLTAAAGGDPDREPSFRQVLRQVRETSLGALAAADVPFERLVQELAPERDLTRPPLFSTMLALQNLPTARVELPGLRLEQVPGPAGVAKYDLSLVLVPTDAGLEGALEYNTDLFDPATAERFVGHLRALLEGVIADPDRPVGDLALIDDDEHHRLVVVENDTDAALPADSLNDLLATAAARDPDACAVEAADGTFTYGELTARAELLAARLRSAGVSRGTLVALLCDRSAAAVTGMLGILRAGAAYLPLDPSYPADRLAFVLTDAAAPVVLTRSGLRSRIPADYTGTVIDLDAASPPPVPHASPEWTTGGEDLAYVIYTSGSTGRPKGVQVPHRAVVNHLASMRLAPGLAPGDVVLSVIPFGFDFSVLEVFLPLVTGARLVLAGEDDVRDGVRLARRLDASAATFLAATPTTWRLLLDSGWAGRPGLTACSGGEALTPELARALLSRTRALWNLYGPTETTVFSTVERVIDPARVTVGRPIANTQVHVLDHRLRLQPVGVPGEICIGGTGVARGYLGRSALTAERFVPDPFGRTPGGRLYRTGDLGRRLPDGRIEVLGRQDDQIKLRGHRIETGEVARVLEECPSIAQAAVVLRADRVGDPQLVAYVTARPGAAPPVPAQVRAWAAGRLPGYMVPAAVVVLERLPLTPSGKVDPRALPRPEEPGGGPRAVDPPATETERRVAAAWSTVLGTDVLDLDDDFFSLGGESLKAVRVVRQIDPSLPVLDLFAHPTIRALAAHIDGRAATGDGERPLVVRVRAALETEPTATLICVPFGGGSAVSFQPLARCAPPDWEVRAVDLPGHDPAHGDEPLLPIEDVARRCAAEILRDVRGDVVLYGHCVGSATAVAIAGELERAGRPVRAVVAGASFPSAALPGLAGRLGRLAPGRRQSARSLQDSLRVLGGLGEELPADESRLLARNLRHDAHEAERWFASAIGGPGAPHRLRAPLLAVAGGADRLTEFAAERVDDWATLAERVELAVLPGAEHFFARERPADLIAVLTGWLRDDGGSALDNTAQRQTATAPAGLRAFLLVLVGQLISLVGTGLSTFALGVWAYQQTGSVGTFAGISAAGVVPAIVVAPLAGAAADRFDRRRLMLACDAIGLITAALLVVATVTGSLQLWQLYAASAVSAATAAFRQPAYLAGATQLVPKRYLGSASGLLQLGTASGTVVAQLLGGAVLEVVGIKGAVLVDAASFAVALGTLVAIRFPDALFARRPEPLGREIVEGARFLFHRRPLLALTLFFTGANALGGLVLVLATPLVLAGSSPAVLGTVLGSQGIGMLAGGLLMAVWGGARRRSLGMLAAVAVFGVSALLLGAAPAPLPAAVAMGGIGVCASLAGAHWLALVQVKVPVTMQGRVISSCLMLARTMTPLAYVVAGPLVSAATAGSAGARGLGTPHPPAPALALVVAATGVVALLWTGGGLLVRTVRLADDLLPDALLEPLAAGRPAPSVETVPPAPVMPLLDAIRVPVTIPGVVEAGAHPGEPRC